jgi:hypothetical protein
MNIRTSAADFKAADDLPMMTLEQRRRIEATVEHLIALLDQYDGDPDIEGSLAGYEPWMYSDGVAACDIELDDSDDEDGGDLEPVLGAPENHPNSWEFLQFGVVCREPGRLRVIPEKSQEHWADGGSEADECEDLHDAESTEWVERCGLGPKINPVGEFMKLT